MMLKRLCLLGLVLVFTGIAHASDVLKVQDLQITPGESVTLNVELNNTTTNLMGFQCDINLPGGLSLELRANGKPAATLGERFATTGHSIASSCLANGDYRFIATSMDGEAIPGITGTLFSAILKADASLIPGTELTGTIKNIEFNTQDNQKLTFDNTSFVITVERPLMLGDANNDGSVTIADAVAVVNYILTNGSPTGNFVFKAANMDGDEGITIADAIAIVNIILSE